MAASAGLILTLLSAAGLAMAARPLPVIFAATVTLFELGFYLWYVEAYSRMATGEMLAISWRVIILCTAIFALALESRITRSRLSSIVGLVVMVSGMAYYAWIYIDNLRALEAHRLWLSGRLSRISDTNMKWILDAREAIGQARVLLLAALLLGGILIAYGWLKGKMSMNSPTSSSDS